MFTYQSPQINQALWLSGLSNQSVAAFQNLIGQCRAALEHRGPVKFDYTKPEMRLIQPGGGAGNFGGGPLDGPQTFPAEPDEQPEEPAMPVPGHDPMPGNNWLPPEHNANEPPQGGNDGPGPQDKDKRKQLNPEPQADNYLRAKNWVLSLSAADRRRHCVFPNGKNANGTVHSVDFKAENILPRFIELTIKDNPLDTTFMLDVIDLEQIEIVTDVELDTTATPPAIVFHKVSGWVFDPQTITSDTIEITDCVPA